MVRVRANGPGSAFIGGTIPLTATTDNTLYFYFVTKLYIAEFSWTDDDATKIVKGASASNLTASAYNSFYQKLGSMRSITSTTYYASNAVNAGDTVTANKMLTLSNGVYRALMYLYGSPNSIQDEFYMETQREIASGKPITAEILSTGEYSLKNMLNRIILALRP